MVARGEFFRSYHLPVLSAEQNDSQSEEINVIDESQAENRPGPCPCRKLKYSRMENSFLCPLSCLLCLVATQKITHAAHSLSWLGELHVKAGYVSPLLAG